MKDSDSGGLGERLAAEDYLRRRTRPQRSDNEYLILGDLRNLLKRLSLEFQGDAFDYGCGGAPYRDLFGRCRSYVKADVTPGPMVDRLLTAEGLTNEPAQSYDLVVSTQVLEHVRHPARYVAECHRILRPGGRLLITTHGMIEEHGCPHDYTRWTARGLEDLVASGGFRVRDSGKLTTEIRAAAQLLHQLAQHLHCKDRPGFHYPLALVRRIYFAVAMPVLNWLADCFPGQAVAAADSPASLYCCVFVWAEKARDA